MKEAAFGRRCARRVCDEVVSARGLLSAGPESPHAVGSPAVLLIPGLTHAAGHWALGELIVLEWVRKAAASPPAAALPASGNE